MTAQELLAQSIAKQLVTDTEGKEDTRVSITRYLPAQVKWERKLNREVVGHMLIALAGESCLVEVNDDIVNITRVEPKGRRYFGDTVIAMYE